MNDTSVDAWRKGQVAGGAREPATSNPYPTDNTRRRDWAEGWRDGSKHLVRHLRLVEPTRRAFEA